MPFDHSTFDPVRHTALLVEQNMEVIGDGYPEREASSDSPVTAMSGTIPRWPLAYAYGRVDKRAAIAPGDSPVIYSTHADSVKYEIRRSAAAFPINHVARAEMETLQNGKPLGRLSLLAQKQILTELAIDWNEIVSGNGTDADHTSVEVVALPAGDEFNATNPAKSPEQYFTEAVQATNGDTLAICTDVLNALLQHPKLDQNGLNDHSMTRAQFFGWLAARGITNVIELSGKGQLSDPRMGYSVEYLHAGVCAIGQLKAIQYAVFNDVNYWTVYDEMAKVDYLIADADYDWVVGYKQSIVAFTNTLDVSP